jgi:hypothetical protein
VYHINVSTTGIKSYVNKSVVYGNLVYFIAKVPGYTRLFIVVHVVNNCDRGYKLGGLA